MPTYVYETIPQRSGEAVERLEIQHGMTEAPYTRHPQTGRPIRRVITAPGLAFGAKPAGPVARGSGGGCGCGPGCGCGA